MSSREFQRNFRALKIELTNFLEMDQSLKLSDYNLNLEDLNDPTKLVEILELTSDIIRSIDGVVSPGWNSCGYVWSKHIGEMKDLYEKLQPCLKSMPVDQSTDIKEIILSKTPTKVLPDGIDYQKYSGIIKQSMIPSIMFDFIFATENILRFFITYILSGNNINTITELGIKKLNESINSRKSEEEKHNYLPFRGDHEIYYLDLIELIKIISEQWTIFKEYFPSLQWISERIQSLYKIRCNVAHNSSFLTAEELRSVETYCREIILQIDPNIS